MQLSCRSAAPDDAQPDQLRAIVADFTRRAANASAGQSMSAEGTNGGSSSSSSSSLGTRQHGGRHAGFCWLVGAGPGALEHLTVGTPCHSCYGCKLDGTACLIRDNNDGGPIHPNFSDALEHAMLASWHSGCS